ncbi:hypothetical protein MC885_018576 [Smutsia gigantea]|nr:hypothetical protein MC885_018576 [Smutsia gigantea]
MGQELCAKTLQLGCSCHHCWEGGDAHRCQRSVPVTMESAIKLTDLKEASCSMTSFHPRGLQAVRARKFKSKRPRSNSDSFQEEDLREGFQWVSEQLMLIKKRSTINGQLVALKVISMDAEEGVPFTAIREASLLKGLKHANIVLLHDIIHTKETFTFVFEYMHTDLAQYMSQHPGGLPPHNVRNTSQWLFRKSQDNEFCTFPLWSCLAWAKSIPSQTYSSEVVTLWYHPPDALLGATEYSSELDIWGAGCIFIEMFQGQPLFPGVSDILEQLEKIWEPAEAHGCWESLQRIPGLEFPSYLIKIQCESFTSSDTTVGQMTIIIPNDPCPCHTEWFPLPKPQSLQIVWNRSGSPEAEDLASQMLKGFPRDCVSAQEALVHNYFSALPSQLHQLPDGE